MSITISDRGGDTRDALQAANGECLCSVEQKGQDWDVMRDISVLRSCGGQQQVRIWEDVELGLDCPRTAGRTGDVCCCSHPECVFFRKKSWCTRLFLMRLVNEDRDGRSLDVSGLKTLVKATLSTRSYRDVFFQLVDDITGRKLESILVVFLAGGEPPLTVDDLNSWNDGAATMGVELGTCRVDMLKCSCCFPRASLAMSRVLHLVRNLSYREYDESDGSDDGDDYWFYYGGFYYGDFLQKLAAEVGATPTPCWDAGGTDVDEEEDVDLANEGKGCMETAT